MSVRACRGLNRFRVLGVTGRQLAMSDRILCLLCNKGIVRNLFSFGFGFFRRGVPYLGFSFGVRILGSRPFLG